jgi:DNA-binding transcriptional LysR family regulator
MIDGAAVVPALAMQKDAYPRLKAIPLVDPAVSRTLVLVSRAKGSLAPAARALYDLILRPKIAFTGDGKECARNAR